VYPEIRGGLQVGMELRKILLDLGADYMVIIGPSRPMMAFAFQIGMGYAWKEIR
jgi:hypothetical protein